ncbi:MAG: phenylacetate--CoA ligase family protein, partial [Dactylosporangium sp.]|nr:phenylacetate--CoA ligase family protein [Dactylosporangium sp.]NNJ61495.1 phenylacetate--CoA ligase family protein [Dactylosporangium sp.]
MSGNALRQWNDARSARRRGPEEMDRLRRRRLADLVAYVRANSPYYRELYRDLPDDVDDPARLPVTTRGELMPRFDDWVTDHEVTQAQVRAFAARPALVGSRFLGRYLVATTSGTTGTPGFFLADDATVSLSTVLGLLGRWRCLGPRGFAGIRARGGRTAAIVATGGHYMAIAGIARLGPAARRTRIFSVHEPVPRLVDGLNRLRPALLVGYTSVIGLLADEQAAGRLRIDPVLVETVGETLVPGERERIATTFHARVRAPYGATECTFLAGSCPAGWYHVNTDWAVAEPVDADHRPVPPGEPSATVLLSNLANRVQPILRYDLGDSVLVRPDPCPCGDPLPALSVRGRSADVLRFATPAGTQAAVAPLALAA